MTDSTGFEVSFGSGRTLDLDEVRRRKSAFMPDNGHAWVIMVVHAIADPDQALDRMELDAASFVGVTSIQCLLCAEDYKGVNRFHKCPQSARR